ncbi:MAG: hypothetical protein HY042_08375 [Spirochaetia bacterium]|nr:hypothetical protein [Spirochaetia bacterium]
MNRAQDAVLASALALQEHVGRTMKFSAEQDAAIARLTVEDVNAAVRRHIDPAKFTFVYAGTFGGSSKKKDGK